jgi:uncharacterized protein (DUF2252 family)
MDSTIEVPLHDFAAREELGRAARERTPRSVQSLWEPPGDRVDPVSLLEEQADTRVPELVPIRYGRMMVSPFAFYRGAALIMASDLSGTLDSGMTAQICGDAHLSNFGLFGTPERTMIFDLNDFDETLPGPWEWDLKRLATSFEIAARYRGYSAAERREIVVTAVRGYRKQMRYSASIPVLTAWYDHMDADELLDWVKQQQRDEKAGAVQTERTAQIIAKARTKDSMGAFAKLVGEVDGELRILPDPPLIEPIESIVPDAVERREDEAFIARLIENYTQTLLIKHHPVDEYSYVHMARKVVGVGSVGTRAWVVLLKGRNKKDYLLLQAKQAESSVLERFLSPSEFSTHGERVVRGQRLMQSASDIFLGWQQVTGYDGQVRDFYIRQLHDWKGSFEIEKSQAVGMKLYAQVCGEALARAHARSGDRVAIAAYMGGSGRFDEIIADFSDAYADQNEQDYEAFLEAIASGRLEARPGL